MKPKLTACKACAKMISTTAARCPNCGHSKNPGGQLLLVIMAVIFAVMIFGFLGAMF